MRLNDSGSPKLRGPEERSPHPCPGVPSDLAKVRGSHQGNEVTSPDIPLALGKWSSLRSVLGAPKHRRSGADSPAPSSCSGFATFQLGSSGRIQSLMCKMRLTVASSSSCDEDLHQITLASQPVSGGTPCRQVQTLFGAQHTGPSVML